MSELMLAFKYPDFNKLTFVGVQKLIIGTNYNNLRFLELSTNYNKFKETTTLVAKE